MIINESAVSPLPKNMMYLDAHADKKNHIYNMKLEKDQTSQIFYTGPDGKAANRDAARTDEQKKDKEFCTRFHFLMSNLLYPTESIKKTFVGFKSNSLCFSPPIFDLEDSDFNDLSFRCDRSETGWDSPVCQEWYKAQEKNPKDATIGDIFQFQPNNKTFSSIFCVPLNKDGKFYAALC